VVRGGTAGWHMIVIDYLLWMSEPGAWLLCGRLSCGSRKRSVIGWLCWRLTCNSPFAQPYPHQSPSGARAAAARPTCDSRGRRWPVLFDCDSRLSVGLLHGRLDWRFSAESLDEIIFTLQLVLVFGPPAGQPGSPESLA